jgi:tRNA pseudouridine55 synthase
MQMQPKPATVIIKSLEPGIHLLHKPAGPSSFAALRAVAPPRLRCCHGGTLDPFASGLLLVLVQPATQLFDLLHDIPKVYDVTIGWGVETGNGDPTGAVVSHAKCDQLTPERIDQQMQPHIGWQDQIPPATSAKRIDGERAYVRAHRGEQIALPPTSVYLHCAEWLDHDLPRTSQVRLTVRGGFYVRSLIRDLGRELQSAAHVAALRRVSIGPYSDPGPGQIIGAEPLPWLPTRHLNDREVNELKGRQSIDVGTIERATWIAPSTFPPCKPFIRGIHEGRFIFVLEQRDARLHPNRLLRGGITP